MNIIKLACTVVLIVAMVAPSADGKRRKKRKKTPPATEVVEAGTLRLELIDATLSSIPFGGDFAEAMRWVRGRVARAYEPRFKSALDARERDKLRHRMQMEVGSIANLLVRFDGQRTGFEASVVQGEFTAGAQESMLLFRDGSTDHYLFFSEGQLWKYARPLRPTDTFAVLVRRWTAEQGKAQTQAESGGEVSSATWTGVKHTLRVDDRRLVSASDLLVLELRVQAEAVAARRKKAQEAGATKAGSDDLDSFIEQ